MFAIAVLAKQNSLLAKFFCS